MTRLRSRNRKGAQRGLIITKRLHGKKHWGSNLGNRVGVLNVGHDGVEDDDGDGRLVDGGLRRFGLELLQPERLQQVGLLLELAQELRQRRKFRQRLQGD